MQKQSNVYSVSIKAAAKIRAIPIGGLICISSSPMFSDKIIALKQSNMTLLVISYNVLRNNVSYVAVECVHNLNMLNWYLNIHISTAAPTVSTSIMLDYTSYSQMDWRYVRNMLGKAAVYPIVIHTDFFDTAVRNLHMFNLRGLKSTFLMCLQFCSINISTNYAFLNMYDFLQSILRSRTVFNLYSNTLSEAEYSDSDSQEDVTQLDIDDDDEEYKASIIASDTSNLALEQQLSVAGLRLLNNIYSLSDVSIFLNFSYLQFYYNLYVFLHMFFMMLLSNFVYFVHYVWLESQHSARLCCNTYAFVNAQLHAYY